MSALLQMLATIADSRERPLEELVRLHMLEGVLRRVACSDWRERLVLRGGLLARLWSSPAVRIAQDVDFLALSGTPDGGGLRGAFMDLLTIELGDGVRYDVSSLAAKVIWPDDIAPGLRLNVPGCVRGSDSVIAVQIDIGFNDPMDPPPCELVYPALWPQLPICLLACRPETGFAWKLHGLFEQESGAWRFKDLVDLWLFVSLQTRVQSKSRGILRAVATISWNWGRSAPIYLRALCRGVRRNAAHRRSWMWRAASPRGAQCWS